MSEDFHLAIKSNKTHSPIPIALVSIFFDSHGASRGTDNRYRQLSNDIYDAPYSIDVIYDIGKNCLEEEKLCANATRGHLSFSLSRC